MSPQLNISSNESSGGGGLPTSTGSVFIAAVFDQSPASGAKYVECHSLTDLITNFGPRSSTSAKGYDFADLYFNEGGSDGKTAYITRVTDSTATTASATLNDGQTAPKPTVLVSAKSGGAAGDDTEITVVAATGTTFTANTTSSSPTLSSVSSFASIGVGTPVTGTGIPAGTYISAISTGASTATMSANATATGTGVTITPGEITVVVTAMDSSGDEIADESHGPYYTTAQLIADSSSNLVTFSQSAASGFTTNLPAAVTNVSLTGGADATDITDTSHVAALANFPSTLPSGTVVLPGRTSQVCWEGIRDHVNAYNRWGVLDESDSSTSAGAVSQTTGLTSGDWSRCLVIQGSATIPGVGSNPERTVPGSAVVATLRAQVANGNNQAAAPFGPRWPLTYITGFTEFYGVGGNFSQSDVNTMEQAGVNCFAFIANTLCLWGFASLDTNDLIYDQASAACERMALTSDIEDVIVYYLADPINLASIENLQAELNAIVLDHYSNGALYDMGTGLVTQAGQIITAPPVNSPTTAELQEINASFQGHITRFADTVNVQLTTFPVTVSLPGATS